MGTLELSRKERSRLEVFARVRDGEVSVAKAAGLLGLSLRQARRAWKRYRESGDAGLVHGLRGRVSNRKTDGAAREAVLKLYREKYADFGPTLAAEKLAGDGHTVGPETLRLWLKAEGLWAGRRHRKQHRRRRERRACRGELVQMDGSDHDWFEGRCSAHPRCVLMVMIDDATGRVYARFYDRETLVAAFDVFGRYAAARGLPRALYVDRAGIYRSDDEPTAGQLLAGERPATQFGRAMTALGVELILANSPQAKGRVERVNRTLQDRLVKALRLAGVSTVGAANALLDGSFLAAFNDQFGVDPAAAADAHAAVAVDLSGVLCEHEDRAVGKDWCVQWRGRLLQVDRAHEPLALPGKRVTVREKADGSVQVLWDGQPLSWHPVERRPRRAKDKKPVANNRRWVPPADHPWKRRPPAAAPAPAARASSAAPPRPVPPGRG